MTEIHRCLAELKNLCESLPDTSILPIQETKDSFKIENIITIHDKLYEAMEITSSLIYQASKEADYYATALINTLSLSGMPSTGSG